MTSVSESGIVLYLDSSAIVKLVAPEPETDALIDFLAKDPERVSSALALVEVSRAVLAPEVSRSRGWYVSARTCPFALVSSGA